MEAAGTKSNIIFLDVYSDDVNHADGNRNSNDANVGHSYIGIRNATGEQAIGKHYWQTHHFCLPKNYDSGMNTNSMEEPLMT